LEWLADMVMVKKSSNNQAEYEALITSMILAKEWGVRK